MIAGARHPDLTLSPGRLHGSLAGSQQHSAPSLLQNGQLALTDRKNFSEWEPDEGLPQPLCFPYDSTFHTVVIACLSVDPCRPRTAKKGVTFLLLFVTLMPRGADVQ